MMKDGVIYVPLTSGIRIAILTYTEQSEEHTVIINP